MLVFVQQILNQYHVLCCASQKRLLVLWPDTIITILLGIPALVMFLIAFLLKT